MPAGLILDLLLPDKTRATGERFGHGWTAAGVPPPVTTPGKYHLHVMQTAVQAPPFQGLILDAGCGEGIDLATVGLDARVPRRRRRAE